MGASNEPKKYSKTPVKKAAGAVSGTDKFGNVFKGWINVSVTDDMKEAFGAYWAMGTWGLDLARALENGAKFSVKAVEGEDNFLVSVSFTPKSDFEGYVYTERAADPARCLIRALWIFLYVLTPNMAFYTSHRSADVSDW